ncbi:hypothetical protein AWL63_11930 [Sphingomonas panacis]|uniref:Uncharacterized protein n=2 Tax=Sphingomonas panacis TaxID=1560345 RepID=A0A1B3ZAX3_9SPHN|nr:hypothetical protein AWL63_11930 [Sphingomonas panacis]
MSIKSNPDTEAAMPVRYAIPMPRRSDTISGALRRAFEAPADDCDMMMLLRTIDQADLAARRA